jgi:hypothetical protein
LRYANDAGAGGKFVRVRSQLLRLGELGPTFDYFSESTKSIIIVAQHNLESAKAAFRNLDSMSRLGSATLVASLRSKLPLINGWRV